MSLMNASMTMQAVCAAKVSDPDLMAQDPIACELMKQLPDADQFRQIIDGNSNGMFTKTVRFRKQYFNQCLQKYSKNYSQLLILCCGLDFSSLTNDYWQTKAKFLLDHPASLELSLKLLKNTQSVDKNATFIAIDLENNDEVGDLQQILSSNNFNKSSPTLILWEGASYYLNKHSVLKLLSVFTSMITEFRIVFDFVIDTFDHSLENEIHDEVEGLKRNLEFVEKSKEPWKTKFSEQELKENLRKLQFKAIEIESDIDVLQNLEVTLPHYRKMFGFVDAAY